MGIGRRGGGCATETCRDGGRWLVERHTVVEERGIRERLGERGAVVVAPWAEGEGGGAKWGARVVRGVVGSVVGGGPEGAVTILNLKLRRAKCV